MSDSNISSAICLCTATMLLFMRFSWWAFALFIAGLGMWSYTPGEVRDAVVKGLKLSNEKLELEINQIKKKLKL